MAGPSLSIDVNKTLISGQEGYNSITVKFSSDIPYQEFECRATKEGEDYGVGKGALIASFSYTPADTERAFEIYDSYLLKGDGKYRISLFAKSEDNVWNDNYIYIPVGSSSYITSDGLQYLCVR